MPGAIAPRPADDQRHVHARVVQPALAPRQAAAVVAVEEHDRVVGQAVRLQLARHVADLVVHRRDVVVSTAPSRLRTSGVSG